MEVLVTRPGASLEGALTLIRDYLSSKGGVVHEFSDVSLDQLDYWVDDTPRTQMVVTIRKGSARFFKVRFGGRRIPLSAQEKSEIEQLALAISALNRPLTKYQLERSEARLNSERI